MLGHLVNRAQYKITQDPVEADAIIVNTCGFIDAAKKESISTVLEMAEYKQKGKAHMKLVVAGCLTQRYKDELVKQLPEADLFIGTGEFHKITEILDEADKLKAQKIVFQLAHVSSRRKCASIEHPTVLHRLLENCRGMPEALCFLRDSENSRQLAIAAVERDCRRSRAPCENVSSRNQRGFS